jgi:tetratricopeptide (TPR) repeat protein
VSAAERALATAQNLADLGRPHDALDALVPALAAEVTAYEAHCLMASILLATTPRPGPGRAQDPAAWLATAREAARSALAVRPDGEWAHRLMASIFLKDGRTAAALREAEAAVRLEPQATLTLYLLSVCQVKAFRQHDAVRTALSAVAEHPHDPVAHQAVAEAARSLSRWDQAESSYRAALRLDPQNDKYMFGLAEILDRQQRQMESAEIYLAAAWINPRSDAPVKALSRFWHRLRSAGKGWDSHKPKSEIWDDIGRECPPSVAEACGEFRRVTREAHHRVEESLIRAQEVIEATVKSLGARIDLVADTLRPYPQWSGAAWSRESYQDLDWRVLGMEEAPVRGDPGRVSAVAAQLRHAGERTAEFGEQFGHVATASTGLEVQGEDDVGFHEIVVGIHADVTRLTDAYLACAAALYGYGDALKWARMQTADARAWAERAIMRLQISTGFLSLAEAKAMTLKGLDGESPGAVAPLLGAVVQEEARVEREPRRDSFVQAAGQAEARRQESQVEWEEERQAAQRSARLALGVLGEAEVRCAAAVRSAISRTDAGTQATAEP